MTSHRSFTPEFKAQVVLEVLTGVWSASDTPQGLKPRSFCLSRVVGTLRNAAWPRLGEYRSGQGKTETGHPSMPTVSWAVPGPLLLSCLSEREEWPTTPVFGAWRAVTPASFDAAPLGTSPKGGGFSLMLFL